MTHDTLGKRIRTPLLLIAGILCAPLMTAQAPGSEDQQLERLRRDQDEVLRKSERLQKLMLKLVERYQRENKPEQVALLQQGLEHLERAGLLKDVASIRDDLAASAFAEAQRKQQEVIADIERLLNILLQRRSIENLDEEIQQTTEMAATARELERLQAALRDRTEQATRSDPNATEQELDQRLQQLAQEQQMEARANMRAAGQRRPFLEDALRRVQDLLRQQDQLEQRAAREVSGEAKADQQQMFAIGELLERAKELSEDVRDQRRLDDLQQQAEALQQALQNGDQSAAQQARDRLQAGLQRSPQRNPIERPSTRGDAQAQRDSAQQQEQWSALREQLQNAPAGTSEAERQQLRDLATRAQELIDQQRATAAQRNADDASQLAEAGERTAEQLESTTRPPSDGPQRPGEQTDPTGRNNPSGQPDAGQPDAGQPDAGQTAPDSPPQAGQDSAAAAVREAGKRLEDAAAAARAADAGKAQQEVQKALRELEEARRRQREQNPDAERLADEMAASADAVERDLRNAPAAESEEQQAAEALDQAEQALRAAADTLRQQRDAQQGSQQGQPQQGQQQQQQMQQSRQSLENAERTLQQALQSASGEQREDMAQAAERQQQLAQQAQQAQQQLQQAQQQGAINEQQAKAAGERMQQAQQSMQQAQQQLQQGQQAQAAQQQQKASEQLQQARDALDQNREMGADQQQALQDMAAEQQKLEEQILRLAEEARERKNPEARRALEDAAEAARRAQQAMQQGDLDETLEQQERARQKLDEAAEQLEEERDRYQDLRQEELLFRMKEELVAFLEKQRPITAETLEAQSAFEADTLSRPARRKLNQHAEVELELAGRLGELITALDEEGNLVYRTVLQANRDDLTEVAQRLAGRRPDAGSYTTMLQHDVERRTEDLLAALEREQQRREQERRDQQQQQQQQQGENRFNPQRRKLVSLIAELEMLKQLEQDTRRATDQLRALLELRSGDDISQAEASLIERLAHRHADISELFRKIKAGVEEALQAQGGDDEEQHGGSGR